MHRHQESSKEKSILRNDFTWLEPNEAASDGDKLERNWCVFTVKRQKFARKSACCLEFEFKSKSDFISHSHAYRQKGKNKEWEQTNSNGDVLTSTVMLLSAVRNSKVRKQVIFSEDGCCQVIAVLLTLRVLKQLFKSRSLPWWEGLKAFCRLSKVCHQGGRGHLLALVPSVRHSRTYRW